MLADAASAWPAPSPAHRLASSAPGTSPAPPQWVDGAADAAERLDGSAEPSRRARTCQSVLCSLLRRARSSRWALSRWRWDNMSRSQASSGTPVKATLSASETPVELPSSASLEEARIAAGCGASRASARALRRNGDDATGEELAAPPYEGEPWPGNRNSVENSGVLLLRKFPLAEGGVGRSTSR